MKIIVDANIVFSSILNSNGKIGDLLINSYGLIEFIATDFLTEEIKSHYSKLVRISKLSLENIFESEYRVCRAIAFISEEQIRKEAWLYAENWSQTLIQKIHLTWPMQDIFVAKSGVAIRNLLMGC